MKPKKPIETLILSIRNQKVILAPDLADVYAVETRALNQAVKRNAERFPEDFIFQLTAGEFSALKEAGKVSGDGRAALILTCNQKAINISLGLLCVPELKFPPRRSARSIARCWRLPANQPFNGSNACGCGPAKTCPPKPLRRRWA